MNTDNFHNYIEHPDTLSASSLAEIQEVMLSFPYFQAAHFLYLKALYNQNSFKFNHQLKQSSVYVANRKKLYYFLKEESKQNTLTATSSPVKDASETDVLKPQQEIEPKEPEVLLPTPTPPKEEKQIKTVESQEKVEEGQVQKQTSTPQEILAKRIAEIKEEKASKTPEAVTQEAPTPDSPPPNLSKALESFGIEHSEDDDFTNFEEISNLIQINAPTEYFSDINPDTIAPKEEKRTFEEWLLNFQTTRGIEVAETEKTEKKSKGDIIDRFLSDESPKIIRPEHNKLTEKPQPSPTKKETTNDFMTETLAKIYIKQGHYDKAIESYRKLSLKYPKKNSYFASQIENIKKIQLNS